MSDYQPVPPSNTGTEAPVAPTSTSPLRLLRKETTLSPRNQTQRTKVLAALSRIASVAVVDTVKEDGHRYYVIDVQFTPNLPAISKPKSTDAAGKLTPPSQSAEAGGTRVQIKRRFGEFSNLRHEMYYHAHSGHRNDRRPCEFCATAVEFLTHAPALPRLRSLVFNSTETVQQQLESFLTLAVQLATKAKSFSGRWCEGQEMVPLLVKQFLLGDDGEVDASEPANARGTRTTTTSAWAF